MRAGLVQAPEWYPWSSAAAHFRGTNDSFVNVLPLLAIRSDWPAFLLEGLAENAIADLRQHEKTGRPLGSDEFVKWLENVLHRNLLPLKLWAMSN